MHKSVGKVKPRTHTTAPFSMRKVAIIRNMMHWLATVWSCTPRLQIFLQLMLRDIYWLLGYFLTCYKTNQKHTRCRSDRNSQRWYNGGENASSVYLSKNLNRSVHISAQGAYLAQRPMSISARTDHNLKVCGDSKPRPHMLWRAGGHHLAAGASCKSRSLRDPHAACPAGLPWAWQCGGRTGLPPSNAPPSPRPPAETPSPPEQTSWTRERSAETWLEDSVLSEWKEYCSPRVTVVLSGMYPVFARQ